jgi:hypothetical protein
VLENLRSPAGMGAGVEPLAELKAQSFEHGHDTRKETP